VVENAALPAWHPVLAWVGRTRSIARFVRKFMYDRRRLGLGKVMRFCCSLTINPIFLRLEALSAQRLGPGCRRFFSLGEFVTLYLCRTFVRWIIQNIFFPVPDSRHFALCFLGVYSHNCQRECVKKIKTVFTWSGFVWEEHLLLNHFSFCLDFPLKRSHQKPISLEPSSFKIQGRVSSWCKSSRDWFDT
jgi:hypothetical protein